VRAQDRAGDHDPDIKVDDENDETDQWSHKPLLADAGSTNSQKFLWSRNVLGDVNGNLWTGVL
jgi:hypothetical protein